MQTTRAKLPTHDRHIWHFRQESADWKRVLCGGISKEPETVEREGVAAERYEKLTAEERALAPFQG